jgi:corrinoid protein of di/trimethylamine methyltransferase
MNIKLIQQAIVNMQDTQVALLIEEALQRGITPEDILEQGLIQGMREVGRRFTKKEYYVPEVLLASEAFYAGFAIVRPLLQSVTDTQQGKIVLGVVHGDIHDIGKNIVKVLVEAAGYKVVDLGRDVSIEEFTNAVRNERPDVLALSSLMTTTMMTMEDIISALVDQGLRREVKVIIGGAPVTAQFARRIGADGYGEEAADAVRLIEDMLSG